MRFIQYQYDHSEQNSSMGEQTLTVEEVFLRNTLKISESHHRKSD